MKKASCIFLFAVLLSCTANNVTPTTPSNDTFDPTGATLLKQGMLVGVNHTVSGTASLYDSGGKKVVLLDPFNSQSGPDLKVYLSKDIDAGSYLKLGNLKSTTGKQSYEVPGMPDISQYTYVHIWCEQFTVVFGRAEIK